MGVLSLLPLGIGDAFSRVHYSSCVAVEHDGAWLLLDCPHPIRKMMHEAGQRAGVALDVQDIHAVALTHLHADHCSGLEGLAFFAHFALQRKVSVVAHPAVIARLWDGHLAAGMEQLVQGSNAAGPKRRMTFDDFFHWIPVSEDRPAQVGPFTLECRPTLHHVPTTAFRIRAGGQTLGYSADTAFDGDLIDWLGAADLVVHETNLGTHTPYERLAALPEELRRRMRLIHFPDGFDTAHSVIEPLEEGRRYPVEQAS